MVHLHDINKLQQQAINRLEFQCASRRSRQELELRRAEERARQEAEAQRLIQEKRRREEEEQRRAEEERAQAMKEAALLQKQVRTSLPSVVHMEETQLYIMENTANVVFRYSLFVTFLCRERKN